MTSSCARLNKIASPTTLPNVVLCLEFVRQFAVDPGLRGRVIHSHFGECVVVSTD